MLLHNGRCSILIHILLIILITTFSNRYNKQTFLTRKTGRRVLKPLFPIEENSVGARVRPVGMPPLCESSKVYCVEFPSLITAVKFFKGPDGSIL